MHQLPFCSPSPLQEYKAPAASTASDTRVIREYQENQDLREILVNEATLGFLGCVIFPCVIRLITSGNTTAKDRPSDSTAAVAVGDAASHSSTWGVFCESSDLLYHWFTEMWVTVKSEWDWAAAPEAGSIDSWLLSSWWSKVVGRLTVALLRYQDNYVISTTCRCKNSCYYSIWDDNKMATSSFTWVALKVNDAKDKMLTGQHQTAVSTQHNMHAQNTQQTILLNKMWKIWVQVIKRELCIKLKLNKNFGYFFMCREKNKRIVQSSSFLH